MMRGRESGKSAGNEAREGVRYRCEVGQAEVRCITARAFLEVLRRRQTGWGEVLGWLEGSMGGG